MGEPGRSAEGASGANRAAFYALPPGGWRDYWSLLHPPYTVWHLSYVVLGGSLAPSLNLRSLAETLAAFFLAMGVAAHALDELHGRPLRTQIPDRVLLGMGAVGLAGALALGVHGTLVVSAWIWAFIAVGLFLVPAYTLEWFGGAVHTELGFAMAWGVFPAITAGFAQAGELTPAIVAVATACAILSVVQRELSTPVRHLRRRVRSVDGRLTLHDGSVETLDAAMLRDAPEHALRWLSVALPVLAAAVLAARLS